MRTRCRLIAQFRERVEACGNYLHNARQAELEVVQLLRDPDLTYSVLHLQARLPATWMSGSYAMSVSQYLIKYLSNPHHTSKN